MWDNAKSSNRAALLKFVTTSIVFLFCRSTYTPASTPKSMAGRVKDSTMPDTAVLEFVSSKTTTMRIKLSMLTAIWEKISAIHKKKNGRIDKTRSRRLFIKVLYFLAVISGSRIDTDTVARIHKKRNSCF